MIVILGSSGGVGKSILAHLEQARASRAAYGEVVAVSRAECDISREESISAFFTTVAERSVNEPLYLLNAAGVSINALLQKSDAAAVRETMNVNLIAPILLLKYFQPLAKARPGSSALFLSSVVSQTGVPGTTAYAATKAGLNGLVRSAAKELARIRARVNCVELGYFDAGMIKQVPPDLLNSIVAGIPLGRLGTTEELFHACDFVLRNTYLTGTTIRLNGGMA